MNNSVNFSVIGCGMLARMQHIPNIAASNKAVLHLFAAHVHTINDVELNSPQFTPAANKPWLNKLPGLFDPHDGLHKLEYNHPIGLGAVL